VTSESAATLRSRYVEQAASDLRENRRRQQELAEKLRMLQQEEALLVDIIALAERADIAEHPSPLPEQAQGERAHTRPKSRSQQAPSSARRAARSAGKQPGTPAAKAATSDGPRRPLLGALLMGLLQSHDEPRLAKELRDELIQQHPDRSPTPQVVRNTLESLVAKGKIRRHKQQRAVMYTVV
jgi:hypothetical protein